MRKRLSLASLPWTLHGYMPHAWKLAQATEIGVTRNQEVGPLPMKVPGSIQKCLLENGILPDWNVGLNARLAEWVENRDWVLSTTLPSAKLATGREISLVCLGLDSHGLVLLNGRAVGEFRNAFVPHRFDLTQAMTGKDDLLQIVFTEIPRALGQAGYTSKVRDWKPRFNYGWDWTSRLVQIGVWDELFLEVGSQDDDFSSIKLVAEADAESRSGKILIQAKPPAATAGVKAYLRRNQDRIAETEMTPGAIRQGFKWTAPDIELWWPNLNGDQVLYELELVALDAGANPIGHFSQQIGFKHVEWRACLDAPKEADPWSCVVNGKPIFLQGVNWTPIRPNFAEVSDAEVRSRLQAYADMGCNLLRVWGGAVLEREIFYRLCDELGLLVWQEFPLSSSAFDNWPPEEEDAVQDLAMIAASYIQRRRHHVSLLMWCGGNELQGALDGGKIGIGKPVNESHPLMAKFRDIVAEEDPGRRFVPTSASGPRFSASQEDFGKGLHWDVHGPWRHWDVYGPAGFKEPFEKQWASYWQRDDSLFRSEVGFPGASSMEIIQATAGEYPVLPASGDNPLWQRTSWWLQWEDFVGEMDRDPTCLEEYVEWSQNRQALALDIAARACRDRFPRIGGFVVWMGHDSFPCTANTAVIDFRGNPKPAAHALQKIFRAGKTPE